MTKVVKHQQYYSGLDQIDIRLHALQEKMMMHGDDDN